MCTNNPRRNAVTTSVVPATRFCYALLAHNSVSSQAYVRGSQVLPPSNTGTTNLGEVRGGYHFLPASHPAPQQISPLLCCFLLPPCSTLWYLRHCRPALPDLQRSFRALIAILYYRTMAENLEGARPESNFVRKTRQTLSVPALHMPLGYSAIIC